MQLVLGARDRDEEDAPLLPRLPAAAQVVLQLEPVGAPAGFEDGGRTAQECYEFARSTWKELAPRWADEIKPLLEQAVKEW